MRPDPYVAVALFAALGDARQLAAALGSIDDEAGTAIRVLARHTLVGMTLAVLSEDQLRAGVPSPLAGHLEAWRQRVRISPQRYLEVFETARRALDEAGVPVLLLKGPYFAERLYGSLERRPQFDVDLLVPSASFGRARHALRAAGFRPSGYDAHSRTFLHGEVKLDLHRCLRHAPAYTLDERSWWNSAIEAPAGPLTVRTLSDEWALTQVLLAAFEDIGQGLARLRQMADLYLLLRDVDRHLDWDAYFAARERESLLGVTANVAALTTALFDAEDDWPRLRAALGTRAAHIADDSRRRARDLVFAPRKHRSNLAWFARIYPGSLARYLAWFWYGGFPANLAAFDTAQVASSLKLVGTRRPMPGRRQAGKA